MALGSDIRRLREAADIQGQRLAACAGISNGHLSLLETDKRHMTLDIYARLLRALNDIRDDREQRWQEALANLGASVEPEAMGQAAPR